MRNLLILISVVVLFEACTPNQKFDVNKNITIKLASLLENSEIFKAKRLFESTKHQLSLLDSLIYSSKLDYYFNSPASSNIYLDRLFKHYSDELNNKTKCDLLKIKLRNHVKLFEYKEATNINSELIEDYSTFLDSLALIDLKNELNLWKALSNQPSQLVKYKNHSVIKLIDGSRIPTIVNSAKSSVNLTFDTGANVNIIISSLVDSLGIKRLKGTINIKGILGNDIPAEIALAKSIKFGNVELENVVFVVFPDSVLYFPHANFQIYGILGYPVISALQEIQLTKENELIIPSKTTESSYSNLAMDYLTPILELVSENDTLLFTFDTGAEKTWIYDKYYKANENEIKKNHEITQLKLGGAGGLVTHNVYLIDFPIKIGDQPLNLDSAVLFPTSIGVEHEKYTGNLGLDAIKSFDKMTLNFEDMFVKFSNQGV